MEKYVVNGTGFEIEPQDLEVFLQKYPDAVKYEEPGKITDSAIADPTAESNVMGSESDDGSLVYEFRTEGNKGAWGKSTDSGKTFDVVEAGSIPEDWFNDPKFKQVYEAENKVEKAEEPSALSAIASSLGVSFVEFQKGNVSMKEAVSLGVFELANKVFGGDDLTGAEKVGVTAAMKQLV